MKIINNRQKFQESAQIVVSLGKSSKFATNLTNSQLRRPKSDLVHEEQMCELARLDQILDKNVSELESPPDYRIRISGLDPDYLRLPSFRQNKSNKNQKKKENICMLLYNIFNNSSCSQFIILLNWRHIQLRKM